MDRPSQMPDEEYAEILEGIPMKDEPFIKKYLSGREALIAQEQKQRSDHAFKQSLSPLAKEACAIVDRIRDEEQRTIWTPEYENILAQEQNVSVFPGMKFSLAQERMEKTRLWYIVRTMPKGSLLHAHMDAMVDVDFLGEVLLSTPGMCVYCPVALDTPDALRDAAVRFKFCGSEKIREGSIWSPAYTTDEPISVIKAAETFPHGGRTGFLAWLRQRCTITYRESLEYHHGVDHVWKKFQSVFGILDSIIFYEPIFRASLRRLFHQLLDDGIRWIELRQAFPFYYYREGQQIPEKTFDEFFRDLQEEIQNFKSSEKGKSFWGVRVIWAGVRSFDQRRIIEDMDQALAMKLSFPDLIAGYDLVGQEDGGRPLKELLPELFWFRKQCAQEGIDIPFFFHAGETLGDGNETDQNLFDAILLGTRRIGHGFSIYKHPLLIDMIKEKRILIESCPISNEVLRYCSSILSHPLPALLARGVHCSLCNDDPAVLGQGMPGLTHDFWQALQGWDNLGLAGLGSLAENSVRWSAFEDEGTAAWMSGIKEASLGNGVKAERLKQWSVEWEQFCLWIVTEFGEDGDSVRKLREETHFDVQD